MTDNSALANVHPKDAQCIERAQKALKKAYLRHVSWRGVAQEYGVNQSYIWRLVERGTVPRNRDIRMRLGLPRILPSEKKIRVKPVLPKVGEYGWEKVYFKPIKARKK